MQNRVFSGMLAIMFFIVWIMTGCAGMKHTKTQMIPVQHDVSVAEAIRVAAQAMQGMGFWITKQNEAAGYLYGEKVKGQGINKATYYLQVHIGRNPGGPIGVEATSIAGPEIAFTDELPGIVNDFYTSFNDILAAKYIDFPEKKPSVKFEKSTEPSVPSIKAPEKKNAPQIRPSPEPIKEPKTMEYEL